MGRCNFRIECNTSGVIAKEKRARKSASSVTKGVMNAWLTEMPAEDLQNVFQMSTPKKISKLTKSFNADIWAL